jgi:hypothetical protein
MLPTKFQFIWTSSFRGDRIRDHNLEIEIELYFKIPRILRLCKTCNKIEDEEHFILEYTINSKLRTDLFAILANEIRYRYLMFSDAHCLHWFIIIIILLSNKHPYMFVEQKKKHKKNNANKISQFIMNKLRDFCPQF